MKKTNLFNKGDIIRTNPKDGFYGIAIVLDDAKEIELSPNRWSKPLCHIAITPYIFNYEFELEDIKKLKFEPLIFKQYKLVNDEKVFFCNKLCIDIYTNKNKPNLSIVGNINPTNIYKEELLWKPQIDKFHLCGDPRPDLGLEAYINWDRNNEEQ